MSRTPGEIRNARSLRESGFGSRDEAAKRHKAGGAAEGRRYEEERRSDTKSYTQGPLDEVFGQHSAFPIRSVGEEDASALETEDLAVLQYLNSVRSEAEADSCVHFVRRGGSDGREGVAGDDPEEVEEEEEEEEIDAGGACATPSGQWQQQLLSKFLFLKEELRTHRDAIHAGCGQYSLPQTAGSWREYIFAKRVPPSVDLLYNAIDHATAIKLLIYCTQWLSGNIPENLSQWIYLLFLRVDNLLEHNESSLVRDLAKKAIKLRQKGNLSNISSYTVDMVICIVGDYYRQRDLLEALK